VIVKPSSPLASFLSVRYALEGNPDRTRVESLWAFVEEYLRSPSSGNDDIQEIPALVLSRKESLVCVKARMNGSPLQFSGFLIDTEGLILSTAHDLQGVQEIVVLYRDQPFQGRLVKIDLERDLSLIRIAPSPRIPLTKARTLLKDGERVYTLGCPLKQHQEGNSGMIDGPVRHVNHFPLWQVKMKILPGSSGSPAFDARGDFVGVVKGRYRGSDSIGFLIPAKTVLEFLKER
jgi:serine protease Do